jgi:6-phosphofructokinase 1
MEPGDGIDTRIDQLGKPGIDSRIRLRHFVEDTERVLLNLTLGHFKACLVRGGEPDSLELAGPRRRIYFDPSKTKAAIVTCGGLCPGLNDVIRAVVNELHYIYGVQTIYGVRYGLQGFIPEYGHDMVDLTPDLVADIHTLGGTVLGSSRGQQDIGAICDCLDRMNIRQLYMIGGDGTLKAARRIYEEITARELRIALVGIPKTIDNDIHLVEKTFGFDSAVEEAAKVIQCAHVEAKGAPYGIGLVKVMGRCSGFIAAAATLAQKEVNFCLVPEVDFDLDGPAGLLAVLRERLLARRHAVIVTAEGAGQKFFSGRDDCDADGNPRMGDIGTYLRDHINACFESAGPAVSLKYIDPSYQIRSVPANCNDHTYCGFLAQNAVHAGMAGKTGMVVGSWNNQFVHVPLREVTRKRRLLDPGGAAWLSVLESTGQPSLKNE